MEEDAEGMDRLDMDGDFVGGRFSRDGEFYYQSRRERAPQARDDALYGVFAEGDSDYDSEEDEASRRRRRRKRRRDDSELDLTRPVQFVSKAINAPEKPNEEEDHRPFPLSVAEGWEQRRWRAELHGCARTATSCRGVLPFGAAMYVHALPFLSSPCRRGIGAAAMESGAPQLDPLPRLFPPVAWSPLRLPLVSLITPVSR